MTDIDDFVRKKLEELKEKDNTVAVQAVLETALYYTERMNKKPETTHLAATVKGKPAEDAGPQIVPVSEEDLATELEEMEKTIETKTG